MRAGGSLFPHLQHCQECLLRDINSADTLHALLAFLLLFQEFALATEITAIAFCDNVLAESSHSFASDNLRPEGRLNGDFEHLARHKLSHLGNQRLAALV